jgi:hypothetical protein
LWIAREYQIDLAHGVLERRRYPHNDGTDSHLAAIHADKE